MSDPKFRYEYKYLVSTAQFLILKSRADVLMQKDPHAGHTGQPPDSYNVRSVYFDDLDNSSYLEKENGTDPREKFRIRIYNHSDNEIKLELKRCQNGKCQKLSCPLTRAQADILVTGGRLPESTAYPDLVKKLRIKMALTGLHPVVIVEYERIPYVYPVGNVRLTMDTNIRSSGQCDHFFEQDLLFRPILQTGQHILEIKWDELFPDFLYDSIMLENLQWSGFSKFYYCRKFQMNFHSFNT